MSSDDQKVAIDDLEKGEWILSKRYMKFDRKRDENSQYFIGTDSNTSWMTNGLVEKWAVSSSQFSEERKVTRTQMAYALHNAKNSPFTVVFTKKNGEKRTLVGYMLNADEMMGRAKVVDLNIDKNNERLVDYRTLEELILDGVKYVLK